MPELDTAFNEFQEANADLRAAAFAGDTEMNGFYWLGISEILTNRMERANQRIDDLKAAGQGKLADKLQRNISLFQQGKGMQP